MTHDVGKLKAKLNEAKNEIERLRALLSQPAVPQTPEATTPVEDVPAPVEAVVKAQTVAKKPIRRKTVSGRKRV